MVSSFAPVPYLLDSHPPFFFIRSVTPPPLRYGLVFSAVISALRDAGLHPRLLHRSPHTVLLSPSHPSVVTDHTLLFLENRRCVVLQSARLCRVPSSVSPCLSFFEYLIPLLRFPLCSFCILRKIYGTTPRLSAASWD